jgi:hypothetical protein
MCHINQSHDDVAQCRQGLVDAAGFLQSLAWGVYNSSTKVKSM